MLHEETQGRVRDLHPKVGISVQGPQHALLCQSHTSHAADENKKREKKELDE